MSHMIGLRSLPPSVRDCAGVPFAAGNLGAAQAALIQVGAMVLV